MPPNNVSFDGNSLQTANIVTQAIARDSLPTKNAQAFALSHSNKSVIPYVYYPSKTITLRGRILGTSAADLDSRIDAFKGYLRGTDRNLDIDYNGATRRYIATVNACTIDRDGLITYADFQITFFCTNPFGIDTTNTTAINTTGNTAIPYQPSYTFLGSAPVQRPVIAITYTDIGQAGTNLVSNPGFETNTTGYNVVSGALTRVTSQFHSGAAAGQMVNAAALTAGYYGQTYIQLTGLTIGAPYTASVWVKGNAGGEAVAFGEYAGVPAPTTATLTTSWQKLTYLFKPTSTVMNLMVGSTSPANATWFIDDVSAQANASAAVTVSNNGTSQAITVNRTWIIGDVLTIDTYNKTVQVNGNDVAFTGAFPEFAPTAGTFGYTDGMASRTFNFNVTYKVAYL